MNIFLAQSIQARNELKRIANVKLQILGAKDSSPIIGCKQDTVIGAYMLTLPDIKMKGSDVANMLCNTSSDTKEKIEMDKMYTGKEIFSHIIPKGINSVKKSGDKITFELRNGVILNGLLDKSALSTAKNSIIHFIWDKYGPDKTRRFIDDSQRLILNYLTYRGQTIGFGDTLTSKEIREQIDQILDNKVLETKYNITQYENETDQISPDIIEASIAAELNAVASNIGQILLSSLNTTNNFFALVKSGAKGSAVNLQQVAGCIGQNSLEGQRIKKKVEGRTIIYFHRDDDTPEARGFTKNSYLDGMSSPIYFFNCMGGREGLIDTAIKTASTGYIQRQLIKGLEDVSVKYDGTTRSARGTIIQHLYGENGINQATQTELMLTCLDMNNQKLESTFGFNEEQLKKLEKEHKKSFKSVNEEFIDKMKKMRNEMREIQAKATLNFKVLEEKYMLPINLFRITQDYSFGKENLELTPKEVIDAIEEFLTNIDNRLLPGVSKEDKLMLKDDRNFKFLLELALMEYISPKRCIFEYGLNKKQFESLMKEITLSFTKAIVEPGEMVGIVAAQSIGEPTSQMSLVGPSKVKVVIKNKKSNEIQFNTTEIGSLCDNIIKANPESTSNTGHINSVETDLTLLDNEYYIIGVDKKEKTHWNKISHVSRHPVNGDLITVTTKSGRSVTTTLSHSHLVRENQSVEPIEGSKLTVGMRIPVAKYIDNTFTNNTVTIDGIKHELDHLFGWFIGAYLAEGCIANSSIHITNISEHFINNTTNFATRFGAIARTKYEQGEFGPSTTTTFTKKVLADFMLETIGTGSFIKKVPDFAFNAPNEFKAGLLQGYFDGDGNFQADESRKQIRVCSRSEQLIKDIALLLGYFGIFGSIKKQFTKGSDMFNLAMSAKYSIPYKEHIDTVLHQEKLNHMVAYAQRDDAHNLSDEIDKINGLGAIIAKCGKVLKLEGQSRTYGRWLKKESIGRRTLNKYIAIFESHENAQMIKQELSILKQAADSNVIWDEIINIHKYTPEQTDYVYDFTVPGNQTFMIDTGIIVHNTLNTKHFAGVAAKSSGTAGVARIQELLHYSKDIKTPQMTIYFNDDICADRSQVNKIASYFKYLSIRELVSGAEIYYDMNGTDSLSRKLKADNVSSPFFVNNQKAELSSLPFVFRFVMNMEKMLDKETTLLDIKTKFISYWYKNFTNLKVMKKNEKEVFSRVSRCAILSNTSSEKEQVIHIRFSMSSFNYNILTDFMKIVLDQVTLKGIDKIDNINISQERKLTFDDKTGESKVDKEWVVYTSGINFERLKMIKGINMSRTLCNDVKTVYRLYGIEAARQCLLREFVSTYVAGGSSINHNHLSVLVDVMTQTGDITSMDRHGLSKLDSDPIARASFEKTMDHFVNAALFNEKDSLKSVSSRIAVGRVIPGGTGSFDLLLDTKKLENSEYTQDETGGRITYMPLEEEPLVGDILKYGITETDFFIPN